jgi:hypothetical protein
MSRDVNMQLAHIFQVQMRFCDFDNEVWIEQRRQIRCKAAARSIEHGNGA